MAMLMAMANQFSATTMAMAMANQFSKLLLRRWQWQINSVLLLQQWQWQINSVNYYYGDGNGKSIAETSAVNGDVDSNGKSIQ